MSEHAPHPPLAELMAMIPFAVTLGMELVSARLTAALPLSAARSAAIARGLKSVFLARRASSVRRSRPSDARA